MAFQSHLATLLVNIIVNTHRVQQALTNTKSGLQSVIGLASGIYLISRAFDAVAASLKPVIDIEYKFATIQRVTHDSAEKFAKLEKNILSVSKAVKGVSLTDFQKAMTVALQGGLDEQSAMRIGEVASKFSLLGELGAEESARALTAILGQFGLGAEHAMELATQFALVADATRAPVDAIVRITERMGGFAQAVRLSAEDVIKWAAVLKETGFSPEVVSSVMNTLERVLVTGDTSTFMEAFDWNKQQAQELLTLINTRPNDGLIKFFDALKKAINISPAAASRALDALKMTDARKFPLLMTGASTALERFNDITKKTQKLLAEGWTLDKILAPQLDTIQAKLVDLGEAWDQFIYKLVDKGWVKDVVDGTSEAVDALGIFIDALTHPKDVVFGIPGLFNSIKGAEERAIAERNKQAQDKINRDIAEQKKKDEAATAKKLEDERAIASALKDQAEQREKAWKKRQGEIGEELEKLRDSHLALRERRLNMLNEGKPKEEETRHGLVEFWKSIRQAQSDKENKSLEMQQIQIEKLADITEELQEVNDNIKKLELEAKVGP